MKFEMKDFERKIVQKDGLYLLGMGQDGSLRWTYSTYEAWSHQKPEKVRMVAKKIGGRVRTFNPINGDVY